MNTCSENNSGKKESADLAGHLAWCALVSLCMAQREGKAQSLSEENLYLIRWLAEARRQHRFSRGVAYHMNWLLEEGRALGVRAALRCKLEYIWDSCSGALDELNGAERLRYALSLAEKNFWGGCYMPDSYFTTRKEPGGARVNTLFLPERIRDTKTEFSAEDAKGLEFDVSGQPCAVDGLLALFTNLGWKLVKRHDKLFLTDMHTG